MRAGRTTVGVVFGSVPTVSTLTLHWVVRWLTRRFFSALWQMGIVPPRVCQVQAMSKGKVLWKGMSEYGME